MANKVLLKKSSVAAKVPLAADLDYGEIALNYQDGKIYYKKADNSIDAFTSGSGGTAGVTSVAGNTGAVTAGQLLTAINTVDGSGSGLDADLLDGRDSLYFAPDSHKYHTFTNGTYYYDSYTQYRFFRLFTENYYSDTLRYCPINSVEYFNYTSSAWEDWTSGGLGGVKNLLDGQDATVMEVDHAHRKFRFVVTKSTGWPTDVLIAMYTSWWGNAWTNIVLTVEDAATTAGPWTVKETITFNSTNTNADYGWHAYASGNVHNGRTVTRITVDIADWVDQPGYTVKRLSTISMFSNYDGAKLQPWTWNYDKNVTFYNTPYVNASQIWHAGNDGTGSGLDADLLDGLNSSVFLRNDITGQGVRSYLTINNDSNYSVLNFLDASNTGRAHVYHANAGGYFGIGVFDTAGNNRKDLILNQNGTITWNNNAVWHAGNDGAGSGLDADLLDGYNIGTSGGAIPLLNGSNTWSGNQIFTFQSLTVSNAAPILRLDDNDSGANTRYWEIIANGTLRFRTVDDAGAQQSAWLTATRAANGTVGVDLTTTSLTANTNTIWHAGNDGAASGLDADLLDGQQGSYYLDTSATAQTKTGDLTITGNLTVNGTTVTINSTTLTVDDKNLELGSVASPTDTTADGGGITLKGATDKTFNWVNATGYWTSSHGISAPRIISTVATGTAPLVVSSSTVVPNLNADLLDGTDFTSRDNSIFKYPGSYIAGGVYYNGGWKNQNATGHGLFLRHSDATGVTAGYGGRFDIVLGVDASTGVDTTAATLRYFSFDRNGQLTIPAPTGTAPLVVSSTTLVTNLNADLLGGVASSNYVTLTGTQTLTNKTLTAPTITGVTSIGFAAEGSDAASISTTVSGADTYFDFNLNDDVSQSDMWRWRFTPSGQPVFNAMTLDAVSNTKANLVVSGSVTVDSGPVLSSNTSLRVTNANGYIDIGPVNTSFCHIQTDRPQFYFDKKINIADGNLSAYSATDFTISTNDFANPRITIKQATGNVGIGTITPSTRLQVGAKVTDDNTYTYDANSLYVVHQTATATAVLNDPKEVLLLGRQGTGGQAFGAAASFKLSRYENSGVNSRTRLDLVLAHDSFLASPTTVLTARSDGNVGIGTTTPAYKLQVSGSFAATTKSFVIDHPTKPDMKLRYGSLEGPENGVYVRGRLKGNKIELPDYWTKLVDPESITVNLTPIGKHQDLYVKSIENNTVTVANSNLVAKGIDCFYVVYGERCDVDKLQVEIAN